jgi:membrane protein implicated in regulation of membrane protease activity
VKYWLLRFCVGLAAIFASLAIFVGIAVLVYLIQSNIKLDLPNFDQPTKNIMFLVLSVVLAAAFAWFVGGEILDQRHLDAALKQHDAYMEKWRKEHDETIDKT